MLGGCAGALLSDAEQFRRHRKYFTILCNFSKFSLYTQIKMTPHHGACIPRSVVIGSVFLPERFWLLPLLLGRPMGSFQSAVHARSFCLKVSLCRDKTELTSSASLINWSHFSLCANSPVCFLPLYWVWQYNSIGFFPCQAVFFVYHMKFFSLFFFATSVFSVFPMVCGNFLKFFSHRKILFFFLQSIQFFLLNSIYLLFIPNILTT